MQLILWLASLSFVRHKLAKLSKSWGKGDTYKIIDNQIMINYSQKDKKQNYGYFKHPTSSFLIIQ